MIYNTNYKFIKEIEYVFCKREEDGHDDANVHGYDANVHVF